MPTDTRAQFGRLAMPANKAKPRRKKWRKTKFVLKVFFGLAVFAISVELIQDLMRTPEERAAHQAERAAIAAQREEEKAIAAAERAERIELQRETAAARQAELDRQQAYRDAACRQSVTCFGNQHILDAHIACRSGIEAAARYGYRWIVPFGENRFTYVEWRNEETMEGLIFSGDQVEFQNGYGAWQRHTYSCYYSPDTDSALVLAVNPGRL